MIIHCASKRQKNSLSKTNPFLLYIAFINNPNINTLMPLNFRHLEKIHTSMSCDKRSFILMEVETCHQQWHLFPINSKKWFVNFTAKLKIMTFTIGIETSHKIQIDYDFILLNHTFPPPLAADKRITTSPLNFSAFTLCSL